MLRGSKNPGRRLFYALRLLALIGLNMVIIASGQSLRAQASFGSAVNPNEYIIRPGDQFRIDFWVGGVATINVTVTPEGAILIADMGKLEVSGLSLMEARMKIRSKIREFYPDSEFTVSLEGLRAVKMFVSGGVKNPGFYDGNVANRVSEYIAMAGGLVPGASSRNIILADGSHELVIDLLRFERCGDFSANPFAYSGEIVRVPMVVDSSSFIQVSGAVNQPNGFEYSPGDNLGIMIDLAFGLNGLQGDSAIIFRRQDGGQQALSVSLMQTDFPLAPADKIIIRTRTVDALKDYFTVTGEVRLPGRYPYHSPMNLGDIIDAAGGLKPEADIFSSVIFRRPKYENPENFGGVTAALANNITVQNGVLPVSMDISNYYPKRLNKIIVQPGDSIVIPSATGIVSIFGQIKRPGVIEYEYPMTVGELIGRAGGTTSRADRGGIRLIRKIGAIDIMASSATSVFDGDLVLVPEEKTARSFLDKVKDWSLILGGLGVVYLAIDQAAD